MNRFWCRGMSAPRRSTRLMWSCRKIRSRRPESLIIVPRLAAISPPPEQNRDPGDNQHSNIKALHGPQQGVPMMPEQVSGAGDDGDPGGRAEEVEERKSLPSHAQHARQRAGENAQAEDEAGKKNGGRAVADEHLLAAFQRGRRNPQEA